MLQATWTVHVHSLHHHPIPSQSIYTISWPRDLIILSNFSSQETLQSIDTREAPVFFFLLLMTLRSLSIFYYLIPTNTTYDFFKVLCILVAVYVRNLICSEWFLYSAVKRFTGNRTWMWPMKLKHKPYRL